MDYLDNGYRVVRIVLTGGPCSGKTTALEMAGEQLKDEGYVLLTMPETATQLIAGGISPSTCMSLFSYQIWQMRLQMEKERVYAGAAEEISTISEKPVLILYDRGMLDNKSYVSDEEFTELLDGLGLEEDECLSWYDVVYHLDTAAKGALDSYTCANNAARTETPEEAVCRDDRILHAWAEHPHHVIIDNSTGFDEKMKRLFDSIREYLHSIPDGPPEE